MNAKSLVLSILASIALLASLAAPATLVRASEHGFASYVQYYLKSSKDFRTRVQTLGSFKNSASGLRAWAVDASAKGNDFEASGRHAAEYVGTEAASEFYADPCKADEAAFSGPHGLDFGFNTLATDYFLRLNELKSARNDLIFQQDNLAGKLANATLNHRPIDRAMNDLLAATRETLQKLDSLYAKMAAESKTLIDHKNNLSSSIAACSGKSTPTPSPSPKPKPTATPTSKPTPKATPTPKTTSAPGPMASHCPGNEVYFPGVGCRPNPM